MVTTLTDEKADALFGALANATRRDILERAMHGDQGVSELAEHYPMTFAAVQKHVAVLEDAGLVGKQRDGRRRIVTTDIEGVRSARELLDAYEDLWRGRVHRMRDLLDEPDRVDEPDRDSNPPDRSSQ